MGGDKPGFCSIILANPGDVTEVPGLEPWFMPDGVIGPGVDNVGDVEDADNGGS